MLAIISDLHIPDGTTGQLLPASFMDLVCERLCDLAWRASWRSGGGYRPIAGLPSDCFGYVREAETGAVAALLNFGDRPVRVRRDRLEGALGFRGGFVLSTDPGRGGPSSAGSFELEPDEGLLIENGGQPEAEDPLR